MSSLVRWVENHAIVLLAVIVVLAAAVRIYGFRGYSGLDDAEYARFAYFLANGIPLPADYTGPAVFPLRVGVIGPTALFYQAFGVTEWTTVLYPFAISLAGIVLVYWCASVFFGAGAGVLAAGLLGAFYWDIDGATRLLPDLPGTFFATAGITLIAWAAERWRERPRRLLLAGVAAGLLLGVSWLCKETVAYLAPFCAIWLLLMVRESGRSTVMLWAGVAGGAASILLGEAAAYYATVGDPLFRLHEMERNYRQWPNGFFTEGSVFGWPRGMDYKAALIDRLFVSGPSRILFDPTFYSLPAIGLTGTIIAWARGYRRFVVPGLWLASLVLMFNFASSSTTSYVPLALSHRYLYLEIFPAIVLASGFLWGVVASTRSREARTGDWIERAAAAIAVAVICWGAAPALYFGVMKRSDWWTSEVRSLDEQVTPATPLYADALSLRAFEFFDRYPATTRWIEFDDISSQEQIAPGSLVLINVRYLEWLDRNAGMWVNWPAPGPTDFSGYRQHSFYKNPPASWQLIWQKDNARVYRTEVPRPDLMATTKNAS
jgi:hypothetical protein